MEQKFYIIFQEIKIKKGHEMNTSTLGLGITEGIVIFVLIMAVFFIVGLLVIKFRDDRDDLEKNELMEAIRKSETDGTPFPPTRKAPPPPRPAQPRKKVAEPVARKREPVREEDDTEDTLMSVAVAASTGSAALGYAAGGSMLGAAIGEMLSSDDNQEAKEANEPIASSYVPDPDPEPIREVETTSWDDSSGSSWDDDSNGGSDDSSWDDED